MTISDYIVHNSTHEMLYVGGAFFDYNVPKSEKYLLKYFKTNVQLAFLRYFLLFGTLERFVEHTGYYCEKKYLKALKSKLLLLKKTNKQAREDVDLELLATIEMGTFKCGK